MRERTSEAEQLRALAAERFELPVERVRVVRVPYRVCPLGAHIDHQLGTVAAMAIDRFVTLAHAAVDGDGSILESRDFPGTTRFRHDAIPDRIPGDWGNYPRAAARLLRSRGVAPRGIVGILSGRLHGGGLSSSAAVGLACLKAFEDAAGIEVPAWENVELSRLMENEYLGLRNGMLDQAAIMLARRGMLTSIDCRASRHEQITPGAAMPPFRILVVFSGVTMALVGTDYNRRVEECEEAARVLLRAVGRDDRPVLSSLTDEEYREFRGRLQGAPARRAEHFFTEMRRVREGVEAWRQGDLRRFGGLMTASGESSIANYECGSPPLIDLHRLLVESEGVLGARFSGAGFRGCCVALLEPDACPSVIERVGRIYAERHPGPGRSCGFEVCETADGVEASEEASR